MYDVVGLGACGIDYTAKVAVFADKDNKVTTDNLLLNEGGVTANNLVQCTRLGMKTAWCGALGDDVPAEHLISAFSAEGLTAFPIRLGQTQVCWIIVNREGEHEIYIHPNATSQLTPEMVETHFSKVIKQAKHFHTEAAATPLVVALRGAEIAKHAHVKVFVDVDGDQAYLLRESGIGQLEDLLKLVRLADVIKLSESAGKTLFNLSKHESILKKLLETADIAVITLGKRGCVLANKKEIAYCPGYSIECTDGTGAGDAFMGGLSFAILHNLSLKETGMFANACGAFCCTHVGTRTSGTLSQVQQLINNQTEGI